MIDIAWSMSKDETSVTQEYICTILKEIEFLRGALADEFPSRFCHRTSQWLSASQKHRRPWIVQALNAHHNATRKPNTAKPRHLSAESWDALKKLGMALEPVFRDRLPTDKLASLASLVMLYCPSIENLFYLEIDPEEFWKLALTKLLWGHRFSDGGFRRAYQLVQHFWGKPEKKSLPTEEEYEEEAGDLRRAKPMPSDLPSLGAFLFGQIDRESLRTALISHCRYDLTKKRFAEQGFQSANDIPVMLQSIAKQVDLDLINYANAMPAEKALLICPESAKPSGPILQRANNFSEAFVIELLFFRSQGRWPKPCGRCPRLFLPQSNREAACTHCRKR